MPRTARIILPNTPHHIVQRGHNRKAVFIESVDYQYYLDSLVKFKHEFGVKVYCFCLMTNHIHLIVEPAEDAFSVSELMKRLAARQTRYANKLENRTGSLWEGRYKISPIQRDEYLLQCCRYVELNPVKARMVVDPAQYRWSSYQARTGMEELGWLDLDEAYLALSDDSNKRQVRYQKFVSIGEGDEKTLIRNAVTRNQLTGSSAFIDEIENRIGLRIENRGRGRPVQKGK